jgi:glycosyltransferase involved in cell wall biosynthesis
MRNNTPIDIVMATYNGGLFLEKQLESLIAQTHQNFTLLIRDDGSEDETNQIIASYVKKYPNKIKRVTDAQGKLGVIQNFACLLGHTTEDYVMFCDQDDIWLPTKIEKTLEAMQKKETIVGIHTPILVHGDLQLIDQHDQPLGTTFSTWFHAKSVLKNPSTILFQNMVTGCTMMINRALLDMSKEIPREALMHDYWFALVAFYVGEMVYLNQAPLIHYRYHPNNESLTMYAMPDRRMGHWIHSFKSTYYTAHQHKLRFFSFRKQFREALQKNLDQAKILLERYMDRMETSRVHELKEITHLFNHGWLKRREILFRYRFWGNDMKSKIVFLLCL